jgi:hypothetical protein
LFGHCYDLDGLFGLLLSSRWGVGFLEIQVTGCYFSKQAQQLCIETFKHLLVECPLSRIAWSLLPWTTQFTISSLLPLYPLIFLVASLKKKSSWSFSIYLCHVIWWMLQFSPRLMFGHVVCVDVVLFLLFIMIFWFISCLCILAVLSFALWACSCMVSGTLSISSSQTRVFSEGLEGKGSPDRLVF